MAEGAAGAAPQGGGQEITAVHGGTRVGRYRLCFEIASGGMASVYLARAEGPAGFEKLVALKRIHPHLAKEREFVEMFLDEARIASRISHPNVAAVFDFGEADGANFLAMEFLLGEGLSRIHRILSSRPAAHDWARIARLSARIIADAAEGLHAAHELRGDDGQPLNVVHRDVSPQNLFVTYDGVVKVVDFGIARAAGKLHHTVTGAVKGKFAYMAPEQAKRQPVDRRADVWSLGVVLWEQVTGKRLFRQDSEVDTIVAVINEPILGPSEVRPGVPPALDAVLLRALDRDPERRTPTAREFGRDLQRFLLRQGAAVGPAEVADWMRELFPEELARRQELVDQARRMGGGPVPRVSERLSVDGPSPVLHDGFPEAPSQMLTRPLQVPRRSRSFLPVLATIAALVGLLGVLTVRASRWGAAPASSGARQTPGRTESASSERPAAATKVASPPAAPRKSPAAPSQPTADRAQPAETPAKRPPVAKHLDPPPSSTPRPPAAPRANGVGTVNVAAIGGWADIFVGGQRRGRTPAQLTLPAGRHVIELRPFARRRTVVGPAGGTARVALTL